MAQDFKKLIVWNEAHRLTLEIYRITKNFPVEEKFGLMQQIRRATYSIELNIAEGTSGSDRRFQNYLTIAIGSCKEAECCLLICKDLELIKEEKYNEITKKAGIIRGMLLKLIRTINKTEDYMPQAFQASSLSSQT